MEELKEGRSPELNEALSIESADFRKHNVNNTFRLIEQKESPTDFLISLYPGCEDNISNGWEEFVEGVFIRYHEEYKTMAKERRKSLERYRDELIPEFQKSKVNRNLVLLLSSLGIITPNLQSDWAIDRVESGDVSLGLKVGGQDSAKNELVEGLSSSKTNELVVLNKGLGSGLGLQHAREQDYADSCREIGIGYELHHNPTDILNNFLLKDVKIGTPLREFIELALKPELNKRLKKRSDKAKQRGELFDNNWIYEELSTLDGWLKAKLFTNHSLEFEDDKKERQRLDVRRLLLRILDGYQEEEEIDIKILEYKLGQLQSFNAKSKNKKEIKEGLRKEIQTEFKYLSIDEFNEYIDSLDIEEIQKKIIKNEYEWKRVMVRLKKKREDLEDKRKKVLSDYEDSDWERARSDFINEVKALGLESDQRTLRTLDWEITNLRRDIKSKSFDKDKKKELRKLLNKKKQEKRGLEIFLVHGEFVKKFFQEGFCDGIVDPNKRKNLNERAITYLHNFVPGFFVDIPTLFPDQKFDFITSVRADSHQDNEDFGTDICNNMKALNPGGVILTDGILRSYSREFRLREVENAYGSLSAEDKDKLDVKFICNKETGRPQSLLVRKKYENGVLPLANFEQNQMADNMELKSIDEVKENKVLELEYKIRRKVRDTFKSVDVFGKGNINQKIIECTKILKEETEEVSVKIKKVLELEASNDEINTEEELATNIIDFIRAKNKIRKGMENPDLYYAIPDKGVENCPSLSLDKLPDNSHFASEEAQEHLNTQKNSIAEHVSSMSESLENSTPVTLVLFNNNPSNELLLIQIQALGIKSNKIEIIKIDLLNFTEFNKSQLKKVNDQKGIVIIGDNFPSPEQEEGIEALRSSFEMRLESNEPSFLGIGFGATILTEAITKDKNYATSVPLEFGASPVSVNNREHPIFEKTGEQTFSLAVSRDKMATPNTGNVIADSELTGTSIMWDHGEGRIVGLSANPSISPIPSRNKTYIPEELNTELIQFSEVAGSDFASKKGLSIDWLRKSINRSCQKIQADAGPIVMANTLNYVLQKWKNNHSCTKAA